MSPAAPTHAPPTAPAATARGMVEQQLATLARLAEIGMEIAEAAGRRARALADGGEAGADFAEPGLSFSRAARAVRLTLALQSKLAEGLGALDRAEASARAGEAGRLRHRIHRHITNAAEAEGAETAGIGRLSTSAWEQLTDYDDEDILGRPTQEIVALICKDLGLDPSFAAPIFADQAFADPFVAAPAIAASDPPLTSRSPLPPPPIRPGGAGPRPRRSVQPEDAELSHPGANPGG